MLAYIVRRLWSGIPVLLGVSLITFILMHVVPGDPVTVAFEKKADPATIERIRREMGLDRPLPVQYADFLLRALRGDLGRSFQTQQPVMNMIRSAMPATLKLTASAVLVSVVIGVPIGILSALNRGTAIDYMATVTALSFISAPVFWVAMVAQLLFGYRLGWLPISGFDTLKHLILPALVLGTRYAASIARYTRSSMLDVVSQDYIRTARAKGLSGRVVVFKHALKNALIPVITVVGLEIGGLLTGSILTESVFGIPGLGLVTIRGLNALDFPVIQATVLLTAVIFVVMNILVDISYSLVDPRIRMT
ncbi:ABC transporter permease [Symbiobacterium thermophilum]|uniref:Oligopeptide ABC transporter permease protein n=2 Tax=Symbiobacterium thermophilum TaxID=2734 RepID=Q67T79_SYMTH|nr:ABC transporter permease [Symbiobacterium thermophilum]MBY6276277.1 ABC transporter permease [Symbiobacterium thermophilum]BAD39114.1 oligopeptide ABC transporter permease protein [Symbiobacterium thermophilum IAM 14863]